MSFKWICRCLSRVLEWGFILQGCHSVESQSERALWLKHWDDAVTSTSNAQMCPRLTLPNLRILPSEGQVLPYYHEFFSLEWRVAQEGREGSWSTVFPQLSEGKIELFARVSAVKTKIEDFSTHGTLPVLSSECLQRFLHQVTSRSYWVELGFPGGADDPDRRAIVKDDSRLLAWANEIVDYVEGEGVSPLFLDLEQALGPAEGLSTQTLSLGEGGSVTLSFAGVIREQVGPEFTVFENSFNDTFLELAWVEVSSNGIDFARFPSQYMGQKILGSFSEQAPELMDGLAGITRAGTSTAFNLYSLDGHPMVQMGLLDLESIISIRVVDIRGDGTAFDSGGHPIYDPFPTSQSAGFDLDGVGILGLTIP